MFRSHCRLPDRRVADEPAESRSRRTGHDPGNGFPLRAVAASAPRYHIGSMNLFDLCDYLSSNVLMPLGGLLIVIFTGWVFSPEKLRNELTNNLTVNLWCYPGHPPADPVRRSGGHHTAVPHADRNPVNPQ
ncbi:MAG: hypothetical protein ACLR8Y_18130 [Alistipes indistinctus]